MPPSRSEIRGDFVHGLGNACQRFIGNIYLLAPEEFCAYVRRLLLDVPQPISVAESVLACDRLSQTIARGAEFHHRWFHRLSGSSNCQFVVRYCGSPESLRWEVVHDRLTEWSKSYSTSFDRTHLWPAAVRAAGLMRRHIESAWYVSDLAVTIGVSTATLERSFRLIYGVTPLQYLCLLRTRAAASLIRADRERSVESAAIEVGYRSVKDAYRTFRQRTGIAVGEVRKLKDSEFSELMMGVLSLPLPGLPMGKTGNRLLAPGLRRSR